MGVVYFVFQSFEKVNAYIATQGKGVCWICQLLEVVVVYVV